MGERDPGSRRGGDNRPGRLRILHGEDEVPLFIDVEGPLHLAGLLGKLECVGEDR